MSDKKIWLSSPHMGGEEMKYIQKAFEENWIAPLGPNVNGFENDLETFLGSDVCVAALSSGTAAIHLALVLLGVGSGDEVLCQSMTFAASANAVTYLGANPVFIDSELSTWNICPIALEEAIIHRINAGHKPKAIITVSLYGMPYKVDEVIAISKKYDIPVIEDSAESLGSMYKGQKLGTFGDFGILSFNGNKIITTSGGGALVSKSESLKSKAVFLSTQAKDDAPHYEHTSIGYNYRMSNVCAGIGRGQMNVLKDRIESRRKNHKFYKEFLSEIPGVRVLEEPNDDYFSNFWLTTILIDSNVVGISREDLRKALLEEKIESRPLWKPMHMQPIFSDSLFFGSGVSEKLFSEGLCLPSGSNLTDDDLAKIKNKILEALGR